MGKSENLPNLGHPLWALGVKRLIDIMGALFALAILWPLLLGVALAVKLSSPGPVFYRGVRAGLNGKPFRIYKFRSMVVDAEKLGGATTGTNDRRLTPIGAFIRKGKIDEFPQFINVLVGDMSLVGPRPEVYQYTDLYEGEEKLILAMRPGITDYSSIHFVNQEDLVGNEDPDRYFREKILPRKNRLRVEYVKNWNLGSDFYLLWQTFYRVVKRAFS